MKHFFVLTTCFLLISCSATNQGVSGAIQIDLAAPEPTVQVSRVVKLDSDPNAYYDGMSFFQITDSYIVARDRSRVVIFDLQGNFVNKIEKVGKSSKEYISILSSAVSGDELYILPDGKQEIMVFNLKGDYQRSVALPIQCNSLYVTDDYIFCQTSTNNESALLAMDKDGEKQHEYIPKTELAQSIIISAFNPFTSVGREVFLLPNFQSSVFEMDGLNQPHEYNFDFGKHALTTDYLTGLTSGQDIISQLRSDEKVLFLNFYPTEKVWNMSFTIGQSSYNWFMDRQSKRQYVANKKISDNILSEQIIANTANEFVVKIGAWKLAEQECYAEYRTMIDALTDDDQSELLIFYNLK